MSKSETFLNSRNLPPAISANMWKQVSGTRREGLEQEVMNGTFRESVTTNTHYINQNLTSTSAGNVIGMKMKKSASTFGGGSGGGASSSGWGGSGGSAMQTTEVYSPLWLMSNLNLPRDLATLNAWSRSFFALNPIVQNAISLHATYPISKLNIKCSHPDVQKFFEEMIEEIGLLDICIQIAQEYWVLGEAFVYADWNEKTLKWDHLLLQNPDYMTVQRSAVANQPLISMRPDENLKRICKSNKPSDKKQREFLSKDIVDKVQKGQNIPFSNFNMSHLARRISPYETRGTSLIVSSFRSLMLFDKIRESKFAQADNLINPLTLIKVGGGTEGYKPMPADLQKWQEIFEDLQYNKDKKLITHDGVTVESVGLGGGIYDTSGDITQLMKEIYIGLMVPSVIMDGGGDITYANGGVALDVLRQRYFSFREMLSAWLREKIFKPVSLANGFVSYENSKETLIVPEVEWNHMSLFDVESHVGTLKDLSTSDNPAVSLHTLFTSLGLDYDDEQRKIRQELIDKTIVLKEKEVLGGMNLSELRGLSAQDEITEPERGEQTEEPPLPGEESGMDLGGLGDSEVMPQL